MSQQTTRKTGFEPGSGSSVIYEPTGREENFDTGWQNYLRDPSQSQVVVSNDPETSFWQSPKEVPGAIKDNHKNAGWLARGETRDAYGNVIPTFAEKIIKPGEFVEAQRLAVAGEDAKGNWGISEEWYSKIYEYIAIGAKARREGKSMNHALAEAGIIDSQSYPTLERVDTQISLEQGETITHIFRQVSTLETTDMLDVQKIFTFVGPGITRHALGDYRVPYPKKGAVTSAEVQQLDKDMAHVAWSEEFFMKTYEANIRELNINSIPFQMEKSKQYKIAVVIDAISGTSKGSWAAYTGSESTRNPYPDIDDVTQDIFDFDGNPNTFVSNSGVYHAWLHNTFVKGLLNNTGGEPFGSLIMNNRVVSGADGVNESGLRWGIDSAMPSGTLAIYDRRAVRLRQGPTNVKDYTDIKTGVSGRIWKDFNLAYNWRSNWTERLTSVA